VGAGAARGAPTASAARAGAGRLAGGGPKPSLAAQGGLPALPEARRAGGGMPGAAAWPPGPGFAARPPPRARCRPKAPRGGPRARDPRLV